MSRKIKESDWKVLRDLYGVALERYCRRTIEEFRSATESCSSSYHDCYLNLFKLIQMRDKQLAALFDDLRRSNAFFILLSLKRAGLITADELMRISAETRDELEEVEAFSSL